MKTAAALIFGIGAAAVCLISFSSYSQPAARTLVLVELFTSEGCSSCPPADQLLGDLDSKQPVPGAEAIVMSEHVDYWDDLGWKDPFSSRLFTDRQRSYGAAFGNADIYTPEMIVDGRTDFIGSNRSQALEAISIAARKPKPAISLAVTPVDDSSVKIQVQMNPLPDITLKNFPEVLLAITETNISSTVIRGENHGRRLTHVGVVRSLTVLGRATPGRSFAAEPVVNVSREWKRRDLRAIAFAQMVKNRQIAALSSISLAKP